MVGKKLEGVNMKLVENPLQLFIFIVIVIAWGCFVVDFVSTRTIPIEKSKIGAAHGDIRAMVNALENYARDTSDSSYPNVSLTQLVNDNSTAWRGPYIARITGDPWGNDYIYSSNGRTYTVQSVHESDENWAETIRYCLATGEIEAIPEK